MIAGTEASRAAFEAWYSHEEYACYPSTKQHMQLVWQASRKAAREEVLAEWADHMTRMNNAIKEM